VAYQKAKIRGPEMPRGRISKRSVDALVCPAGRDREFLWDDGLSGFGVAAFPTGKKVYVCQYRQDGRSRRSNIGEHGRLTPDEARSEAKKLLGIVEAGSDPIAERRKERGVRTFAAVAEDFLALHVATKRKGRTGGEYRCTLQKHLLPAIGTKRIVEVRRADVTRLHAALVGTPYAANRMLSLISSIWNWAAKRDEVALAANPCRGIERYPEHGRERYLTGDEWGRLGAALGSFEAAGGDPYAAAAIRLLILTGARLREVLDAKWSEVDLQRGVIFLPDSKTGKKTLYLSTAALEVLASLPRTDNPHIIPGEARGGAKSGLRKPFTAVCKLAGLKGLRIHDLRHSFASVGAGEALGLPVVGKLLGHTLPRTTAKYAHLDSDPMRRAVDTIGATISAAMARDQPTGEVVPLRGVVK
jgi:integrase